MDDRGNAQRDERVAKLQAEIEALRKEVASLRDVVQQMHHRYTTTCDQCGTIYDLLAHHYSVGLFDNVVYVKCPKCQKAVPVEGRLGEGFRLVKE
jgi:predicted nucleic acid-binding Zn ribbon protein